MIREAQKSSSQGALRRLRSSAAPLAKTALLKAGAYTALRRCLPSRQVAILRYHAVCGDEGEVYADPSICISPEAFTQHASYLATNYTVLGLDEIAKRLAGGAALPVNAVAITFDDGYADNLDAARILNRFRLPATFFITAGCLAGEQTFWVAEVRRLILAAPPGQINLRVNDAAVALTIGDAASRSAAVRTLNRLIKSHPIATREGLRAQLRDAVNAPAAGECMLTWAQLAEMQALGMTVGAHTLTHPNLPSADLAAAADEIIGSKHRLERELGQPVTLFSYPNGGAERYYTPEIQRVVQSCGFVAAATSRNGFAGRGSDLFALERIEVEERLEDLVYALEVERFG